MSLAKWYTLANEILGEIGGEHFRAQTAFHSVGVNFERRQAAGGPRFVTNRSYYPRCSTWRARTS